MHNQQTRKYTSFQFCKKLQKSQNLFDTESHNLVFQFDLESHRNFEIQKGFSRQYLIISNDLNLLLCATSKHENALLFSFANEKMVVGRFFLPWVVLSPRLMESRDFSGAHTTTITFFSKSFLSRFHD